MLFRSAEEPLTRVDSFKSQHRQLTFTARYFVRPELFAAVGLGLRQAVARWKEHESLGSGRASGEDLSNTLVIAARFGRQWSFKNGAYLTFEPAAYDAALTKSTKHKLSRQGAKSQEVDERAEPLAERGRLEGIKPTWQFFNLYAGKMF